MRLKKLYGFGVVGLIVVNILIIVTDHSYLYKGVANTYLKGRIGPQINEADIFYNRAVKTKNPVKWKFHDDYNKSTISKEDLDEFKNLGTVSYLIIKDNQLFFEKYWEGFTEKDPTNAFSMAKTFVGVLTGIALKEQNKLVSVDQKVTEFLPDLKINSKGNVKIKHLLTMSSGLSWSESGLNPFSDNAKAYYGTNLEKLVKKRVSEERPGVYFRYKTGDTQLLAMVLEKVVGKSISQYAEEKLWTPLNAEHSAQWNLDKKDGMEKAFCCFYATPRDFARIGQLYLNGGTWNKEEILDKKFVIESIQPAELLNPINRSQNHIYGYTWWLDIYKNMNVFYARGIKGQYIIVIPSENMILVRTGHHRSTKRATGHYEDFYFLIDVALNLTN